MNITDIKVRRLFDEGNVKALVSITLDNEFAIHELKVIEGRTRMFVSMPNRRDSDGGFLDIAHPMTRDVRLILEKKVLEVYYESLEKKMKRVQNVG